MSVVEKTRMQTESERMLIVVSFGVPRSLVVRLRVLCHSCDLSVFCVTMSRMVVHVRVLCHSCDLSVFCVTMSRMAF